MNVYFLPNGKPYWGASYLTHREFKDLGDFFAWLNRVYESKYPEFKYMYYFDGEYSFIGLACPEGMVHMNLWIPSDMSVDEMMQTLMKE